MEKSKKDLVISNLHVSFGDKAILRGVSMRIANGRITALMGPNGSGKSTLSHVLMGNPNYIITKGEIFWCGKDLREFSVWERAKLGLFLSFQNPYEISGVNMHEFLLTSFVAIHGKNNHEEFDKRLAYAMKKLKLMESFLDRSVNEGFSGGEKKKNEILQLLVLKPRLGILDEVDSGLDIDSMKLVATHVKELVSEKTGFLVITHYQRLLNYLAPHVVYVMLDGQIVQEGSRELVKKLEKKGYTWLEI